MNIVLWIFFGTIVGVVAHILDPYPESGGAAGAIVLGIAGALVGGVVANLILGISITQVSLSSFVIASLASLFVLFVQRALFKKA